MLEDKKQEQIAGIISDFCDGTIAEADIDIIAMRIYENVFKDSKWQKLKEWGMSFLKDCDIILDKSKKDSYLYNSALHHKRILTIMLATMQELEGEDE